MLICEDCGHSPPLEGFDFACPKCSGVLGLPPGPVFDPRQVDDRSRGIWRYRHTFPFGSAVGPCTLGEGATPLVEGRVDRRRVHFKLESLNPTGSFKDRGTSVLVSLMASRGVSRVVEDSSGNAGASLAAYCARAGIVATIFCPLSTSPAKVRQAEVYGAELVRIAGPRRASREAAQCAAREGAVYASHVCNPVGLAGIATAAFEIWEQLHGAPQAVVVPVGQGTFLLGLHRAFADMRRTGLIASLPRLFGVQAELCAPLSNGRTRGGTGLDAAPRTTAEGICIPDPLRTREVAAAIEESGGAILTASEASIAEGVDALARQGLYVEPTSAVVWPVVRQLLARELLDPIVVVLTGHGLKTAISAEPSSDRHDQQ